jgi:rhodanese-related sulfurtransferase
MHAEHATTVERLLEQADAGAPFLLLDVRNDDEYAAWKVEGVAPQLTVVTRTIAQSDVAVPVKDARAASVVPSAAAAHETPTALGLSSNDR